MKTMDPIQIGDFATLIGISPQSGEPESAHDRTSGALFDAVLSGAEGLAGPEIKQNDMAHAALVASAMMVSATAMQPILPRHERGGAPFEWATASESGEQIGRGAESSTVEGAAARDVDLLRSHGLPRGEGNEVGALWPVAAGDISRPSRPIIFEAREMGAFGAPLQGGEGATFFVAPMLAPKAVAAPDNALVSVPEMPQSKPRPLTRSEAAPTAMPVEAESTPPSGIVAGLARAGEAAVTGLPMGSGSAVTPQAEPYIHAPTIPRASAEQLLQLGDAQGLPAQSNETKASTGIAWPVQLPINTAEGASEKAGEEALPPVEPKQWRETAVAAQTTIVPPGATASVPALSPRPDKSAYGKAHPELDVPHDAVASSSLASVRGATTVESEGEKAAQVEYSVPPPNEKQSWVTRPEGLAESLVERGVVSEAGPAAEERTANVPTSAQDWPVSQDSLVIGIPQTDAPGGVEAETSFVLQSTASTERRAAMDAPLSPQAHLVDASRAETARAVGQQMAAGIAMLVDRPVELTLSPEELGRVRLTMQAAGDQTMVVSVQAERHDTLELMRRHIDSLMREFREMGYSDISFSFSQHSEQGKGKALASDKAGTGAEGSAASERAAAYPSASHLQPIRISLDAQGHGLDLRI